MTNPVLVVREQVRSAPGVTLITDDSPTVPDGRALWMWCPGCEQPHRVQILAEDGTRPEHGPVWDWDGNLERPTVSPSILCYSSVRYDDGRTAGNCHSFVRVGQWQFLPDSAHKLAGQIVDMVPLPDWLVH